MSKVHIKKIKPSKNNLPDVRSVGISCPPVN